ncbi:MAG TPA: hypothetical protein VGK73_30405 [Polyangiaceae bacterium]
MALFVASGCEPRLIVGKWSAPAAGAGTGGGGTGGAGATGGAGGMSGAGTAGAGNPSGGGAGLEAGAGGDAGAGGEGGAAAGTDAGAGGQGPCDPTLPVDGAAGEPAGPIMNPVTVPWSTDFENGFCDYTPPAGFCYVTGNARFEAVSTPAHSGVGAVAFSVNAGAREAQTRCVRQGTFPIDAVYGAWFYVPAAAEATENWNLMFFNGASEAGDLIGFWDVSIHVVDGRNVLVVFDQRRGMRLVPADAPDVPIGAWFHIEFRLRRSAAEDGLIELYQDGVRTYALEGIATDDSVWAQWYVGNLAAGRTPPDSTLYVDDVSIRAP